MSKVDGLIDFIVRCENGGKLNWNSVSGFIPGSLHLPWPLTHSTVQQVLDWQASIRGKVRSTAAGGPQFIYSTLSSLANRAIVSRSALFDEDTQRQLAVELLRGRGLERFLSGATSVDAFCNELAKEWASLPVVTGARAGKSYYDGDGLNSAHTTVQAFRAAVEAVRSPLIGSSAPSPAVAPASGAWAQFRGFINAALARFWF